MTATQLDREQLPTIRPRRVSAPPEGGQLFDVVGLAEYLGVSQRFVRRLVDQRRIPFLKIGKFIRFQPDEIAQWVSAHRVDVPHAVAEGNRITVGPAIYLSCRCA